MNSEAIVTKRNVPRIKAIGLDEINYLKSLGHKIKHILPYGILISGDEKQFEELRAKGYHVKKIPNTNILNVGRYKIDITTSPPKISPRLGVPRKLAKTWKHHLVQLIGPPLPEWIQAIKEKDIDVVEPISSFGLFVVGLPEKVNTLKQLPFVAWVGPFKPAYRLHSNLSGRRGKIQYVDIGIYPEDELKKVKVELSKINASIHREELPRKGYSGEYSKLIIEVFAKYLTTIARLPGVRWLEYVSPRPGYDGERETQIVAENLNATGDAPVPGYQAFLTGIANGAGVTIAICDSGVDENANNNADGHLDLRGRQTAFVDYTGGVATTDTDGHGTHVAGIAIGNAATGQTDALAPNNFLWGQGMAPQANYVTQNATWVNQARTFGAPWPPVGGFGSLTEDAVNSGANVMNNSWWDLGGIGIGYTANARTIDQLVRNPNNTTAILDDLIIVFSAGNSGGDLTTITSPKEAKNIIVVGSSFTWRPNVQSPSDDINGIVHFSSRGPAADTRILPNVVAPGHNVSSLWSETGDTTIHTPIAGTGTLDPTNPANSLNQYLYMNGTSMSAPHVSGLCALLVEWWRDRTGGKNPSQALVKALLINGAEDLNGGENWRRVRNFVFDNGNIYRRDNLNFVPNLVFQEDATQLNQVASLPNLNAPGEWFYDNFNDALYVWTTTNGNPNSGPQRINARDSQPLPHIPNNHQGWGRVSARNIFLQHPNSDRGRKIFSDQRHAFTANLQEYVIRIAPDEPTIPIRITLVWTDSPGAANANPALVNDLDLEVTELTTGNIYRGNEFDPNTGFSRTGGNFDNRDNIECVYVENPSGTYEVRIIARDIRRDARPPFDLATPWQDFALVIDNAEYASANPVCIVPVVDRSGSMTTYGYVDVTRKSSKQFIDLLSPDDEVGLVSFGNSGEVEYPTDGTNIPKTVTDSTILEDVKAEIDQIDFIQRECTFMGDGIIKARDLLNQSPANLNKAMVLLSDGYDNRGEALDGTCGDYNNPAKPSALDVAGNLVNIPVYTCAMGQNSDQELLEDIADLTNGQYYYMPTIDDLYEIYNYIRGQVSGDGIIVNDSSTASKSRLGGWVDCDAIRVTFTVAWGDNSVRYVDHEPKNGKEISIRLRNPNGKLLYSNCTYVKRKIGDGYVVFSIAEPIPGRWYVEVETAGDNHIRYTVGGFVNSPIRMVITQPKTIALGERFEADVKVFYDNVPITSLQATAKIKAPSIDIPTLLRKYKDQLKSVKLDDQVIKENVPEQLAKLVILRNKMLAEGKPDIFAHTVETVKGRAAGFTEFVVKPSDFLKPATVTGPVALSKGIPKIKAKVTDFTTITRSGGMTVSRALSGLSSAVASLRKDLDKLTGIISQGYSLKIPVVASKTGSLNIAVTVSGISPMTDCRFERKELLSMVIRK